MGRMMMFTSPIGGGGPAAAATTDALQAGAGVNEPGQFVGGEVAVVGEANSGGPFPAPRQQRYPALRLFWHASESAVVLPCKGNMPEIWGDFTFFTDP